MSLDSSNSKIKLLTALHCWLLQKKKQSCIEVSFLQKSNILKLHNFSIFKVDFSLGLVFQFHPVTMVFLCCG